MGETVLLFTASPATLATGVAGFCGEKPNFMIIPGQLSKTTISELQCDDTVLVRVLLHSVSNSGQARLRCRNRQYIFEKNYETGCHLLDIPMSVWMHGVNPGRYRDQRSVCDDFRELPGVSFTIHLVDCTNPDGALFNQRNSSSRLDLRRLLVAMHAPAEILTAFDLAAENSQDLAAYVDGVILEMGEDARLVADLNSPELVEAPEDEEQTDLKTMNSRDFKKKYGKNKTEFLKAKNELV